MNDIQQVLNRALMLIRFRWLQIVLVSLLVSSALSVAIWFIPNKYSASTTILVDPQKVPEKYVSSTISEDPGERLNTLTQSVLSTTRLSAIIERYNLYPKELGKLGRERVLTLMRNQIQIQIKRTSGNSLSAFSITFHSPERSKVAPVTNQLAQSFIDWNLESRQEQVQGTIHFLDDALARARKNLDDQDEKLRNYRLEHIGEMPEQQQANLQTLNRLQANLQANADALNRLDQERLLTYNVSLLGRPASAAPTASPLEAEIAKAKQHLQDLQERYTPQHPDVIAAAESLKQLQKEAARQHQPVKIDASGNQVPTTEAELYTQRKEKLQRDRKQIEDQVRHYQALVDAVPIREEQVSQLTRDYQTSKENYSSLLEKSYSAQMATQLEEKQQGERFQVLDPALPPDRADSPNRPVMWVGALFAGLACGIGIATLREHMDNTISEEAQLIEALPRGVPVIGRIPHITPVRKAS